MKQKLFYEHGDKWAEITLKIKNGVFTACGSMGEIVSEEKAREMALEYWRSFFEENPDEIWEMNKRCNKNFGPKDYAKAAQFVLSADQEIFGEYHGLNVHKNENDRVYLTNNCGQCLDSIQKELPKFPHIDKIVTIWEKWHLNDVHAGCEHQRALGWEKDGYDKHPCEPCPVCDYKFGSAWHRVELPEHLEDSIQRLLRSR